VTAEQPVLTRRVVRNFGSTRTHVVDVPPGSLAELTMIGRPFTAVDFPVAALCAAVLRSAEGYGVAMKEGTRVHCPACRRISGLEVAAAGNHLIDMEAS
jgi:hypothetical protein